MTEYGGKKVYVDVRGITDDLGMVISKFVSDNCEIVPYTLTGSEGTKDYEIHGLVFANQVIMDHPSFYDISRAFC